MIDCVFLPRKEGGEERGGWSLLEEDSTCGVQSLYPAGEPTVTCQNHKHTYTQRKREREREAEVIQTGYSHYSTDRREQSFCSVFYSGLFVMRITVDPEVTSQEKLVCQGMCFFSDSFDGLIIMQITSND